MSEDDGHETWMETETVRTGGSPWVLMAFGYCLLVGSLAIAVWLR